MQLSKPVWWKTLLQYLSWLVAAVLAILDVLMLREALITFLTWNQVRIQQAQRAQGLVPQNVELGFTTEAIAQGALFILGIVAVGAVIWIEYYFRKGAAIGMLFKRIGIVLGVEVGLVILAVVLQMIFG